MKKISEVLEQSSKTMQKVEEKVSVKANAAMPVVKATAKSVVAIALTPFTAIVSGVKGTTKYIKNEFDSIKSTEQK